MKGENCVNTVNTLMPKFSSRIVTAICGGLLLSGCVMTEKYDAEKARSLNFQRLLAQEEKRTGELDSEVKRSRSELMEYEARSRELTAQVQAVQEQLARAQEEAEVMKESALLERTAKADVKRMLKPMRKIVPTRKIVPVDPTLDAMESLQGDTRSSAVHVVKPGETLFRISRQYRVTVDKIRKWNTLQDDIIEVGQKLIVGQE